MTIAQLIQQERLPSNFSTTVERYYQPLASRLAAWHQGSPLLFGINGGQGTGKSTMALFLSHLLESEHGLATAVMSVDDLYLTRVERERLGREVHPLLVTRGVPGTHDPELGLRVIESLMEAGPEDVTPLPRFSKVKDDRFPEAEWPQFKGRADVVILEGWCVGARPQAEDALTEPVNALERDEDADGCWRKHVNDQLAGRYQPLFSKLDRMVLLRAPSMACIHSWRREQEEKLRQRMASAGGADGATRMMTEAELDRFIAHYQRLTEHQWRDLPSRADATLKLGEDHCIRHIDWKEEVCA